MHPSLLLPLTLTLTLTPALVASPQTPKAPNPFFSAWNTPFEAPDFRRVKVDHFMPAFKEGMKRHQAEIHQIANAQEKPTFKNTLEALDQSGEFLSRVSYVFSALSGNETTPELQAINRELTPLRSAHYDDINFNEKLWLRIKAVYNHREKEKLTPEQMRLLEERYKGFVRSGANLEPQKKERMRQINSELSKLSLTFGDRLLKATKDYKLFVSQKGDLAGLPEGVITAAAAAAEKAGKKGQWLFTLDNPSMLPFLQYADNRELRKQILTAYLERGEKGELETHSLASQIADLRVEKAKLLGYTSWAHFILEENMAKSPEGVYGLLNQLWKPALKVAQKDRDELQALFEKDHPGQKLEAWDWRYYEEKVRKARFNLDETALKPYFSLDKVRDGVFMVAGKLYGLTFHERKDLPTWHPEVRTWEVKEKNGKHLGLFYADYHPRPGKRGGAWCSTLRPARNGGKITPIATNTGNFTRPTGDKPALLTPDEVETLFHEFGHALHGLFYKGTYRGTANVSRDFVELPSQIMEHWAMAPEVLKMYARHYKTHEPIPDALIEKIEKAGNYGQGFKTVEYLAASFLDMAYHSLTEPKRLDVLMFEKKTLGELGTLPEIPSRYKTPYFNHIWAGGYSAGYYAYIWSEVLDSDAFQAFVEKKDLFHPATAKAFRKNVLEKGNTEDPALLYRGFRGRDPKVDALLKNRGL